MPVAVGGGGLPVEGEGDAHAMGTQRQVRGAMEPSEGRTAMECRGSLEAHESGRHYSTRN